MRAPKLFRDRRHAGQELAHRLRSYRDESPVVLALPRGGVPVAYEVATQLGAPFDVCIVRKIGAPFQPELGIGAVAEEDAIYIDRPMAQRLGISAAEVEELAAAERIELEARVEQYRRGEPPLSVQNSTVILVDDGIATGGTARAAIETLRTRGAGWIVLAIPVGATSTLAELQSVADEIVCLNPQERFSAVGQWYEDFASTTDEEVFTLLDDLRARAGRPPPQRSERVRLPARRTVRIAAGDYGLEGILTIPENARALVLFAHGSGSGKTSPRNRFVASELEHEGFATLLFDLLTREEEVVDAFRGHIRFDIDLLTSRLVNVTDWTREQAATASLPLAYFGASTGVAAAITAAVARPEIVRAVVSRGGRPDLAEGAVAHLRAPTLLIVGEADREVLAINRHAFDAMSCVKQLEIIPGATHLFEEPGALEQVAQSAAAWIEARIAKSAASTTRATAATG